MVRHRSGEEHLGAIRANGWRVTPFAERILRGLAAHSLPPTYVVGAVFGDELPPGDARRYWDAESRIRSGPSGYLPAHVAAHLAATRTFASLLTDLARLRPPAKRRRVAFVNVLHEPVFFRNPEKHLDDMPFRLGMACRHGESYLYAYAGFQESQVGDDEAFLVGNPLRL